MSEIGDFCWCLLFCGLQIVCNLDCFVVLIVVFVQILVYFLVFNECKLKMISFVNQKLQVVIIK